MIRLVALLMALIGGEAMAREPAGLDRALAELTRQGRFSGAVVIRGPEGVQFARGYGMADPFTGRRFTPDTPVDSGSLAKPVTAAIILDLARAGRIDLDAPVARYVSEFPHAGTTVRHLLAHSAGLPFDGSAEDLVGKSNADLVAELAGRKVQPGFQPGTAFSYCNLCFSVLALLAERVTGRHYIALARELGLPRSVSVRPQALADWTGRAIGYRRTAAGRLERFDSWEGEAFYGPANLSISASQLARWGAAWQRSPLLEIRPSATQPAEIAGKTSGLTLGNWYCASGERRCHYPGHHEGLHNLLYWNADRQIAVALVSNNTLAPSLQQRLQRAVVAFAEGRPAQARREIALAGQASPATPGRYRLGGEVVEVSAGSGPLLKVRRQGLAYTAFPIGEGWHYVPGLDVYVAGAAGRLRWLSLHEDHFAGADKAS